jgi:8-oxo-dGTP pyrophosphatase MutT (NUDIX family)
MNGQNKIVLFKRIKPGLAPYWVAPGGGLEKTDISLEAAVKRELAEELGAKIEILKLVFDFEREITGNIIARESFFLCTLVYFNISKRTGKEFEDPSRGQYIVDELNWDAGLLEKTNIKPDELKEFLIKNVQTLFALPDLRNITHG